MKMKSTTILVLLLACLVVAMAKKPKSINKKKCNMKLKKVAAKLDRKLESQRCAHTVTWSACTDGKLTKSYALVDPDAQNCTVKPSEEMDCVKTVLKKQGKKCPTTKTMDFSQCSSTGNFTIEITSAAGCYNSTMTKPCPNGKVEKREFMTKFLEFNKKRWELACEHDCQYGKKSGSKCNVTVMEIDLERIAGDENECPATLTMPCNEHKLKKKEMKKQIKKGIKKDKKRQKIKDLKKKWNKKNKDKLKAKKDKRRNKNRKGKGN